MIHIFKHFLQKRPENFRYWIIFNGVTLLLAFVVSAIIAIYMFAGNDEDRMSSHLFWFLILFCLPFYGRFLILLMYVYMMSNPLKILQCYQYIFGWLSAPIGTSLKVMLMLFNLILFYVFIAIFRKFK